MSPFALNPPGGGIPSPVTPTPITSSGMRAQLGKEEWFHGPISRYKNSLGKRNGFMVLSPGIRIVRDLDEWFHGPFSR